MNVLLALAIAAMLTHLTVGKDEIKRFTCGEREWEFMKPSPDCESDWFGCYGPALRTQLFTNSSTVAKVPCGFNKPSGYDALRVELEEKLKGCDSVLYTGNFHRVSGTKVPQLKREQSDTLGRVCPVIILDEVASERVKADNVAGWTVVVVKGLPYEAVAKSYKVLKILGGRLWPDYIKRTLFMDASRFKKDQDLLGMFEAAVAMQGSQPTSSLIAFKHYDKTRTIQKEARKAAKRIHGHGRDGVAPGAREGLQIQVLTYEMEGYESNNNLIESNMLIRDYRPEQRGCTQLLECAWFGELDMFTYRDQPSFPYVMDQLGLWPYAAIREWSDKSDLFRMTVESA